MRKSDRAWEVMPGTLVESTISNWENLDSVFVWNLGPVSSNYVPFTFSTRSLSLLAGKIGVWRSSSCVDLGTGDAYRLVLEKLSVG